MNKIVFALVFLVLGALILGGADMTGEPLSLKRLTLVGLCLAVSVVAANWPKRNKFVSGARRVR